MTKNLSPNKFLDLQDAVENLIVQLQHYESDTFNANQFRVSRNTAEKMAAYLIRTILFDPEGIPGDAVDGAVVEVALTYVHDAMVAEQKNADTSLWWSTTRR